MNPVSLIKIELLVQVQDEEEDYEDLLDQLF